MSGGITSAIWLLPALPLCGAAVLLLAGRRTNAWGHLLACVMALASFVVAVVFFIAMLGRDTADRTVTLHFASDADDAKGGVDAEPGDAEDESLDEEEPAGTPLSWILDNPAVKVQYVVVWI